MIRNNCKLSYKQIVEYGEEDTITYDSARRCFVSSSPALDQRTSVEINLESSKMCSNCGNVKKDLKLSDRMYYCDCGHCMDRDVNASINLANYIV